jgi:RNA polymerase sigma factor (sigma-70 family)
MSEAAVSGGMRSRAGVTGMLSDSRLARRAVKGDERALAAIFERYHQDLYRYCTAILGNPTDAQDALQNTMVKVLRALPGEERQVELKPWLYRIAHNEAIELIRRRRPAEQLGPELPARGGSLAEEAEARERLRRLMSDLEELPERQRGALVMRELAGLGFAEIAASLGTSEGVARQTLYEARLSLRQMDEGREMSCDAIARALSDADGRVTRRRDIRAHLRACPDCRRFREEVAARRQDFAGLAPLPAVAAAGLLQGLLGGGAGSAASGAGLAGAVGGGAAKSLGAGAAIKSAAAVGAIAVVGVGAADRGGIVDATPWNGDSQGEQGERSGDPRDASSRSRSNRTAGSEAGRSGAASGASGSAGLGQAAGIDARPHAGVDGVGNGNGPSGSDAAGGTPAGMAGNGAGGPHPRGRGHDKQRPDAASDGQQTAAGHKASAGGGSGGANGANPTSPVKPPPKPVKPTQPSGRPESQGQPPPGGGGAANPPKAPAVPEAEAPPPPVPSAGAAEPKPPPATPPSGE